MTDYEYVMETRRTAGDDNHTNLIMGLFGESGELVDLVKKHVHHSHQVDEAFRRKLLLEAGDVLWYVARLWDSYTKSFGPTHAFCSARTMMLPVSRHALLLASYVGSIAKAEVNSLGRSVVLYADVYEQLVHICEYYGLTMDEVKAANVAKLQARYPEGFSAERSQNRVVAHE